MWIGIRIEVTTLLGLKFEQLYIDRLPEAEMYERSYMHRDVVTHIVVTKAEFIITGSVDGHIYFWKKQPEGIEFVKHYRAHLGAIRDMTVSGDGQLLCSVAADQSLKVFDIINFDMINMCKLPFVPTSCAFIHKPAAKPVLAVYVPLCNCGYGSSYFYAGQKKAPIQYTCMILKKPLLNLSGLYKFINIPLR